MEYKDERSEDLRLHLFRGALDLEAFPVLARRRRRIGAFDIDASIIGASHAVQLHWGGETITEVLACRVAAVDLYADRLSSIWRIDEAADSEPAPGLDYRFRCELLRLSGAAAMLADFRDTTALAEARGGIGLSFLFPQKTALAPETLLHVAASDEEMRIRSVHIYPGEDVAVLSDTCLALRVEAGREPAPQLLEVG